MGDVFQVFLLSQEHGLRGGATIGNIFHNLVMPIRRASGLWQVGDAEHLNGVRQESNLLRHLQSYLAADAHVDFVENQSLLLQKVGNHHFYSQRDTGNFAARRSVLHAAKRFAGVRREIKFHFRCPRGRRHVCRQEVELHPRIFHAHIFQRVHHFYQDLLRRNPPLLVQRFRLRHQCLRQLRIILLQRLIVIDDLFQGLILFLRLRRVGKHVRQLRAIFPLHFPEHFVPVLQLRQFFFREIGIGNIGLQPADGILQRIGGGVQGFHESIQRIVIAGHGGNLPRCLAHGVLRSAIGSQ